MATSSFNSIRVRLYFDYPPPATPECRMCWLLVDLNKCRVVADLSSIIKEKFGYGRKSVLDLFVEDCYLPTTESIFIVRDNDSIRVKVSSLAFANGAEVYFKGKKRVREDETQISVAQASSKKKKQEGEQINGSAPADSGKKKKPKKKKKEHKASNPDTTQKSVPLKEQAAHSSSKTSGKCTSSVSTSDKTTRAKNQKSISSSSDSSEDESHSKPSASKPEPRKTSFTKKPARTATSSTDSDDSDDAVKPSACKSKIPVTPKPSSLSTTPKLSTSINSEIPLQTPKPRRSPTDSSSSSLSSPTHVKPSAKNSQVASQTPSTTQNGLDQSVSASGSKQPQNEAESSDSDVSEIELVIKKPNLQGMGLNIAGLRPSASESAGRGRGDTRSQERGRGRGGNRGNGRGGFGRAKGTPWKQDFHYNYENGDHQKQRESLTNESFIIQNPSEPEPAKQRDYTTLPLLAAPPVVGQKIAFKLLELTENYTPEVSDYKEGKIIAFNPQTKMLELELLSKPQATFEPGKFDLVYENPDGSERVEYAVTHGSQMTERWDSLLEPRLIVENDR